MDRDECEMPFELPVGEANRFDEVAVVVLLDQVRDGLGVRLGGEDVTVLASSRSRSSR